jgi:KaiC domain protein, Ph0284 family
MVVPRVRTYVPGLDEILYGGIPERSVVLLSGGPGTGKSILGKQFLYNGLKKGEPGVFVALEEHPVAVRRSFRHFGWDISQYEREGKFAIVDAFTGGVGTAAQREKYVVKQVDDVYEVSDVLRQAIKDVGAKRVVVDSVSTLYLTKPSVARATIMTLKRVIAGLGCTAFFVSQVSVGERGFGGPGVEHAVDGIIRLDLDEVDGKLYRSIIVWKMRDTKHSMLRHPMEIKDTGVEVLWDKYLRITATAVKIEPLPKEDVEAMRRAVEEAEKQPQTRKVEIEVEE